MSIAIEKYKALIDTLYQRTCDKKIAWQVSDAEIPFAEIGGHTIVMTQREDAEGAPLIRVSVFKPGVSAPIDAFDDNSLSSEIPGVGGFTTYWMLMSDLFATAVRQAKGADDAIDAVLSELKKS